ncbi:MAG: hypothetical protein WBB85_18980 [Albidovulum sp.]|uniref:hypothetical protein n=1 Tax=Albidovulum sp. TaxID=1872424 RepID=UPI003CA46C72
MSKDTFHWEGNSRFLTRLSDIPKETSTVLFYREKRSQKGISKLKGLKRLGARMVNQDFLDEIGELNELVELKLEIVTATDLSPLEGLTKLRALRLANISKISDFSLLPRLPALRYLYIENAKKLTSLDFLEHAQSLRRLGIEGGLYSPQKIPTLAPLGELRNLEELYLASVQLVDKNLSYLTGCENLTVLRCARFAHEDEFNKLSSLMPQLDCHWFNRKQDLWPHRLRVEGD